MLGSISKILSRGRISSVVCKCSAPLVRRSLVVACPVRGADDQNRSAHLPKGLVAGVIIAAAAQLVSAQCEHDLHTGAEYESHQTVTNWSATHSCNARKLFEPQSAQEVLRVLQFYGEHKMKLRPVGTALSPNGIGLTEGGADLLTMRNINDVVVNAKDRTVTVGAGATVQRVLEELKKEGLTLENFSSIQEQQMAGWTQVAAHGTGITLPTVEEQIVRMRLATPGEGLLTLSADSNPRLFGLAKVGLGSLGVVTELTLRCVPSLRLSEKTICMDRSKVAEGHTQRLQEFRHVRYMWIPHTSTVVTVCSNPADPSSASASVGSALSQYFSGSPAAASAKGVPTKDMFDLLLRIVPEAGESAGRDKALYKGLTADKMTVADLRSELLSVTPLDLDHVKAVNRAEEAYWKASEGSREADSTAILGFDCGGEQLVYEVCIPMGRLSAWQKKAAHAEKSPDITFMEQLLAVIEDSGIPAHSPIEQRWTARSTAPMSPAYSLDPEAIFSWIGIIMYLPQDPERRKEVAAAFRKYSMAMNYIVDQYGGQAHWAKIELPERALGASTSGNRSPGDHGVGIQSDDELSSLRSRLRRKYPVDSFNEYRRVLDPENVLSNQLIDELFSK